ncbi:MAG: hypothetical protein CMP10_16385 [Zetaproteobacteria bacterium]|nr:hypothetical protein [Pseudobdellovibrionaceae bacterium]
MKDTSSENGNVLDFNAFRSKKEFERDISRGRLPLHVSHLDGKVKGSPHLNQDDKEDFSQRMQRIRQSLEKINLLMAELKKNPKK